jgi:hypothetical protein
MGMIFDSHPGSFHHDGAQFTTTLLGDPPTTLHLPGGMNPSTQTRIAHSLFGRRETRDLAYGGQNRHRTDHPQAGQLEEKRHLLAIGKR